MLFADALTLDKPRRTKEGYLAVRAKAARAGIYDYLGREVDPDGKHFAADAVVKVWRPADEVFAKDSVHSFMLKPITDNHPAEPVTADSWSNLAKGVNAGAMRDGEYLAFDLVLMDAGLIDAVDKGKRELSNGYSCDLEIGDGTTPEGDVYNAVQRHIRGNHIAVVAKGRAGSECRIGDAAACDSIPVDLLERLLGDGQTYNENSGDDKKPKSNARREPSGPGGGGSPTQDGDYTMPHVLIIDGLQVPNVSDEAKAAIEKLQGQVTAANDAKAKAEGDLATAKTDIATRDAEIVTLKQQVKDAEVTPAQLLDAAKDYAAICDKAKALGVTVADNAAPDVIMKAVVDAKMGDVAKDYDAKQIAAAFAALDAKAAGPDPLRKTIADGVKPNANAGAAINDARRAWLNNKEGAYRGAEVEA